MASPTAAPRSKQSPGAAGSDDVVLARALEFTAWARQNARAVIAVAVVAAVVVGGLLWYSFSRAQAAEKAAIQYMQVERTLAAGNPTLAERELTDFIGRFSGSVEADQARLALGRLHLEAGKPQEAVTVLQNVGAGLDTPLGAQGAMLLAAAQNQAGNRDAAVATYLRVADETDTQYYAEEALQEVALLREAAGDFAGAAQAWRRLVEMTEAGSFQRSVYEMRLAEAEGQALGG